ncbi:MAG TPA: 3-phosphoshikimate 1-carboxyvinyltransferase, partial [Thermoanaerobaculia bacterium]
MSATGLERRPDGILVPAGRRVAGEVEPPPSKSLTHRAFALALLAAEPLVVERPLVAEDTALFRQALARLGWTVEEGERRLTLAPGPLPPRAEIHCGNAGTMFRFLVALLAA